VTGVVVAQGGDRWWAWTASRVKPAPPREDRAADAPEVSVRNEFSGQAHNVVQAGQVHGGVHFHDGRPAPPPDDSAWLRSAWPAVASANGAIEMRCLTSPESSSLDGFLVLRAEGASRPEAERRATELRDHLAAMPGHATSTPVTDDAETHRILAPFPPHGEGVVEVRKRLTTHRTSRDDAHHPWLTAVTPLTYQRQPWDQLWSRLAALPCHAMLSVGLVPYPVGAGLRSHLAARAADLSRLATQGPSPTAVWRVPRAPDEFAVAALPLISDAVRRYTDRAFVIRVSVAADRPIPGVLAELAADTISARTATPGFAGAPPAVIRPGQADLATAWRNITALNVTPLPAYDQGNPEEAIGELERVLSAIVDLDEAAAAFRLPYRNPGQASPFGA